MLSLLAGLFFGGFILPVGQPAYPVRFVWMLPVRHRIDALQDVVLRGDSPRTATIFAMIVSVAVDGAMAVFGLRRQRRVGQR